MICAATAMLGCVAYADGGYINVHDSQKGVVVRAGISSSSNAQTQNVASTRSQLPTVDPIFGVLDPSTGCYWKVDTGYSPPAWDTADQHPGQLGAWYDVTCPGTSGTGGALLWVPIAQPVPGGPAPSLLAEQASNFLSPGSPQIQTNPPAKAEQITRVPTWLWLTRGSWHQLSATAAVTGVSVTATASPEYVIWRMGDGSTVVCRGPGTPWSPRFPAGASSPTCGHTYTVSSADQPGGVYTVTVTVVYTVRWAGAGQAGTLPVLRRSVTTYLRVGEAQAINN